MTSAPRELDLDAARRERAAARAAQHEERGETLPVRFGGGVIAILPAEFPLDVLSPLQDVNVDLALLVRQAMDVINAGDRGQQTASLGMLVDVLAANPNLPAELLGAIKKMGEKLLGAEGYAMFLEQRPTPWDIGALVTNISSWYGVSLGESSSPSESSTGGATSPSTSSPALDSTHAVYGPPPAPPGSSAFAAS